MAQLTRIPAEDVHATLAEHLLTDGYPLVVDLQQSRGNFVRDARTGEEFLDFFSFFASNPVGFNHPRLTDAEMRERLRVVSTTKVSNSDFYSRQMADFVDTLARTAAPPHLPHYFFVDGGALAVENAMKVAFDWKVQKNLAAGRFRPDAGGTTPDLGTRILHFQGAFHGRSGYTLSVTNTDPVKTRFFPKFDWPRVPAPFIQFPLDAAEHERLDAAERECFEAMAQAFDEHAHDIAAILIEPIQGEGGDRHFRPSFFRALREFADEHEALLIFDEVQTGLGMTGKWWAFQHGDVKPDIVCFAKKMQVGGILVSNRVDEVPENVFAVPSRINSTWGASLVDMVRCTRILEIIDEDRLLDNAAARGTELLSGLFDLARRYDGRVTNPRGLGLMCAIDLPNKDDRNEVIQRCFDQKVLVLPCGQRSVRFRPPLTVSADEIDLGIERLGKAIDRVCNRQSSASGVMRSIEGELDLEEPELDRVSDAPPGGVG